MKKYIPYLKNKFIIAPVALLIWIMFFDNYDVFSYFKNKSILSELEQRKQNIIEEIEENQRALNELTSNPENLEKYARERFLMKKKDETIFILNPKKRENK